MTDALTHAAAGRSGPLLLCLSHLRWDSVVQRPHHLMRHAAQSYRVVFWEEPVFVEPGPGLPRVVTRRTPEGILVATPSVARGSDDVAGEAQQAALLDALLAELGGEVDVAWYYTPMMLQVAGHLQPGITVFDCMDELSAFRGASPRLLLLERRLLRRCALVFAGGRSLHAAKARLHPRAHLFPSSVDAAHFGQARPGLAAPPDQAAVPTPRIGFHGVIDERMDLALLATVADRRPDWHFMLVGPVVKIDPASLPRRPNIHWLGPKPYAELPAYLAGWAAGWMPFALNEATRFISPTKTPEFLAAGVPVVSTAVGDVVHDYGRDGLVEIAACADQTVTALDHVMTRPAAPWRARVDKRLESMSWDSTWARMRSLIEEARQDARQAGSAAAARRGGDLLSEPAEASRYDWLIVGAGFAGAVLAERLARVRGDRVLVVDRRDHIAGNAYDHLDGQGVLVHRYGPHIFHTNSAEVFGYLSQFTRWRPYEHRVLGQVDGQLVPIPINLDTVNALYGLDLTSEELEAWFAARAESVAEVRTSEDVIVSRIGRELYEKFFQGYTRKQWGLDPSQLDRSVTARVPVRTDRDGRYFTDTYQAMPRDGYTAMFGRMLDQPGIDTVLGVDGRELGQRFRWRRMIWTGPVDEFFAHRFGKLPYRSLRFRHEQLDREWFQAVGTVNYPQTEDYTRITEYKHLTGQVHPRTSITYEYPAAEGDPYYPVPRPENQALYKRYQELADREPDTWFAGRLATYRYMNMDQVVGQALALFKRLDSSVPRRESAGAPPALRTAAEPA